MLLAFLAAAAVTATAAPPPAQVPMTEAEIAAAKAEAAAKYVCRTEQVTGSRFPQKVCRPKAELEAKKQEDQDRMRQMQRSTGGVVR